MLIFCLSAGTGYNLMKDLGYPIIGRNFDGPVGVIT